VDRQRVLRDGARHKPGHRAHPRPLVSGAAPPPPSRSGLDHPGAGPLAAVARGPGTRGSIRVSRGTADRFRGHGPEPSGTAFRAPADPTDGNTPQGHSAKGDTATWGSVARDSATWDSATGDSATGDSAAQPRNRAHRATDPSQGAETGSLPALEESVTLLAPAAHACLSSRPSRRGAAVRPPCHVLA
jgi:hypothetical protein